MILIILILYSYKCQAVFSVTKSFHQLHLLPIPRSFPPCPLTRVRRSRPRGGGDELCVGVLHRHVTLEHPPLLNVTAPVLRIQIDAWAVRSRGRRSYQNRGLNATWLRQETTSLSWLELRMATTEVKWKEKSVFRDPSYQVLLRCETLWHTLQPEREQLKLE